MKTNKYTTTETVLRVVGHLWGGGQCDHEYSLRDRPEPKTLAEAKRIAGDFESLSKAVVISTKRTITEQTTQAILPVS